MTELAFFLSGLAIGAAIATWYWKHDVSRQMKREREYMEGKLAEIREALKK